ncbi:glycoside hydrolase family 97 protein [Novosphingobium capsulatum]|uniref:glycoside hydrolase family 97 protein n=1 Tax=Novosphingobium capsulatum TaxID=13688 RepID=UPI000789389B|nr:glycoside hydrolase family 97 protein [Novosphingobium capsulatum]WQD94173.1 glycoside hydrolase family 97 protein [Novosphingobium capsulatum]
MEQRLGMIVAIAALVVATPALGQEWQTVTSPDGRIVVDLAVDQGEAVYRARYNGKAILDRSRLGFRFKDAAPIDHDLALVASRATELDRPWTQPWGERRQMREHYRGLVATLAAPDGRKLGVEIRVFDDGFGFRYTLPGSAQQPLVISDEETEFHFAQNYRAWSIPAYREKYSEYEYSRSALSAIQTAQTPLTLEGDGVALAVHEAALVDFPSMNLRMPDENSRTLKADLSPWSNGDRARTHGGAVTPWRVVMVAPDAAHLADSTIVLNLNEPNRLGDVSWVKPEKYIGIFWAMHTGLLTWEPGPKLGATTARAKSYIDWAAQHGIAGVLVEGWNVGWDVPEWWKNGHSRFVFDRAQPAFDMAEVSAYARAKGVDLIGHHETGAQVQDYLSQLEPALDYYDRYGVRAIKLGYVGTRLDQTEWPDSQYAVQSLQTVVAAAARHHIAIFPHEPVKDTGLRRTWPNLMSREGARGQEYNGGSPDGGNAPDHTTILPFTRLLSGPFDYTPGVVHFDYRANRPDNRVPSTLANQLALYVVLYSPVQMAVDLPEHYDEHADAFRFIHDVPTDWEESRTLQGAIGEYAVVARRDRHSPDWYLGAITNDTARRLTVPLDFLDAGARYEATIYADGPGADWRTAPEKIVIRRQTITARDTLALDLARGGGQAIRFRMLR